MRNKNKIPANHNKSNLRLLGANMSVNPLLEIDEKRRVYQNGDLSIEITCLHSKDLPAETLAAMVDLTEETMKEHYEKSEYGWNRKSKEKEFKHDTARILLAKDASNGKLLAFVHYRFELDDEEKFPVVYCYEIQMPKSVQGKGLGRYLMDTLLDIGVRFKMNKVMITCFKHNTDAFKFYEKLGYGLDICTPSKCGLEKTYEIMNLKIRAGAQAS